MNLFLAATLTNYLIVQYKHLSTSRQPTFWWGGRSKEKHASSLQDFTEVPPLLLTYNWPQFSHIATPNTEIWEHNVSFDIQLVMGSVTEKGE